MNTVLETECTVLEDRFQNVISDLRNSFVIWEDFTLKAGRLHNALKSTAIYSTAFLESFQRLADAATSTRGATKDIGSAMTRLCLRHRNIDSRMKGFTSAIMDSLVLPLQERMEDWKRTVASLDREHAKEYKKVHQEIRKASLETIRLQKKVKKGKMECRGELEKIVHDGNEKLSQLHEIQKNSMKAVLVEERSRLCLFISCLKPVMDEEVAMLTEVTHVQEILQSLCMLAGDPEAHTSAGDQLSLAGGTAEKKILTKSASDDLSTSKSTLNAVTPGSPSSAGSLTSSGGSIGSTPLYSPSRVLQHQRAQSQLYMPRPPSESDDPKSMSVSTTTLQSPTHAARGAAADETKRLDLSRPPPVGGSTSTVLKRHKDVMMYSGHAERPHTISSAYEKSTVRPGITPETYLPPSSTTERMRGNIPAYQRTQSYTQGHAQYEDPNSHYAVPCLVPQRKPSGSLGTKVADIYARPSLIPAGNKSGYRTPNFRPLPVATPTVPDMEPTFPVAGYVNMNQLANMAAHQQMWDGGGEGEIKKEDLLQMRQHSCPTGDLLMSGIVGRSDEIGFNKMELDKLSERLELASRLSSVDKYCTLTNQSRAAMIAAASTAFHSGAPNRGSMGAGGSIRYVGMPGQRMGAAVATEEQNSSEEWESDRDSPIFN